MYVCIILVIIKIFFILRHNLRLGSPLCRTQLVTIILQVEVASKHYSFDFIFHRAGCADEFCQEFFSCEANISHDKLTFNYSKGRENRRVVVTMRHFNGKNEANHSTFPSRVKPTNPLDFSKDFYRGIWIKSFPVLSWRVTTSTNAHDFRNDFARTTIFQMKEHSYITS